MGQTDASIVQLAMPSFEDSFDAPLGAVSWVSVGYVLAFAGALPIFARLAEMAGRKTIYLAGFALFGVFSAACALAPGLASLIAFRILLGIGGAMLGANSVVIIVAAAGPERRGKALGIQAAAQAVGLSAGPALGGVLLGAFGWRARGGRSGPSQGARLARRDDKTRPRQSLARVRRRGAVDQRPSARGHGLTAKHSKAPQIARSLKNRCISSSSCGCR